MKVEFSLCLLTFILATCCFAAEFNCGSLDAATCKQKFAEHFNSELKVLHDTAFRKLCKKYMEISTKVVNELEKTDLFIHLTNLSIHNVAKDLEDFDENINDRNKVAEITSEATHHMEFTFVYGSADPENYRNICKKYKLREELADIVKELTINIGKLYTSMYGNLRAIDLKTFPQYETINTSMVKLEKFTAKLNEKNNPNIKAAVKVIGIDLEVPLYDAVLEVS